MCENWKLSDTQLLQEMIDMIQSSFGLFVPIEELKTMRAGQHLLKENNNLFVFKFLQKHNSWKWALNNEKKKNLSSWPSF